MDEGLIAGRYRLLAEIGRGGMGAVLAARDEKSGADVAVKLLHGQAAATDEPRARFEREARLLPRIRSEHVVKVLDHGVDEEGRAFMVMELLDGESLRARLRRGALPPAGTAALMDQLADAIAAAHAAGLVHRDLKPENIFLCPAPEGWRVKVLDFGMAKVTDLLAAAGMDPTRTGTMLGTPYYMSPEQAQGKSSVDRRTDLWALGVLAYECLTGVRPFRAPSLGPLIALILQASYVRPSERGAVSPAIDVWMAKALALEPDERFQSAGELAAAFRAAVAADAPAEVEPASAESPATAKSPPSGGEEILHTGTVIMASDEVPPVDADADADDEFAPTMLRASGAPAASPLPGTPATSPLPGTPAASPLPGTPATSPLPGAPSAARAASLSSSSPASAQLSASSAAVALSSSSPASAQLSASSPAVALSVTRPSPDRQPGSPRRLAVTIAVALVVLALVVGTVVAMAAR